MISEEDAREELAAIPGCHSSDAGQQGAVKIRIKARRRALRDVLELDDDQDVCNECHTVGKPSEWPVHNMCEDCTEEFQTRLDEVEA